MFTAQAATEAALCEGLAGRSQHALAALAACPDFAGTCSYVEIVSEFIRVFTDMIVGEVDRGTNRLTDLAAHYLNTSIPLLHDGLRVGFALRAHAVGNDERAHHLVGPTITPDMLDAVELPRMSPGFPAPDLCPERRSFELVARLEDWPADEFESRRLDRLVARTRLDTGNDIDESTRRSEVDVTEMIRHELVRLGL